MSKRKKTEAPTLEPLDLRTHTAVVPIASLMRTYTKDENPNHMDADAYAGLVATIRRNGFLQPILVRQDDDGALTVIDGHHRLDATIECGRATIEAVVLCGVDAARAHLLGLGLNRYRGDMHLGRASAILRDVNLTTEIAFDDIVVTSGFSDRELRAMLETPAAPENMDLELPDEKLDDAAPARPFVLEIRFERKEEFQLARKRLKKAAGKGGDLAVGLLAVLGESADA